MLGRAGGEVSGQASPPELVMKSRPVFTNRGGNGWFNTAAFFSSYRGSVLASLVQYHENQMVESRITRRSVGRHCGCLVENKRNKLRRFIGRPWSAMPTRRQPTKLLLRH